MKRLRIGIAYDVKEDYRLESNDWKYADFSTLNEIQYIKSMFEKRGHIVHLLGNYEKIYNMLKSNKFPLVDVVFNTAEGIRSRNREGWIPTLFEINNIPYAGSDAFGLSLSLSKLHTKLVARYLNIPTPDFVEIRCSSDVEKASSISGPWVLKPNYEGSSSGVVYVDSLDELRRHANRLLEEYQQSILCETYIDGREANVSILYDGKEIKVIGAVEVVRKNGDPLHIYDAYDKFHQDCTKIPAEFSEKTLRLMYDRASRLHQHFNCKDYNRADFRIDSDGKPYFLELNPAPGVSEDDSFTLCCKYHGYDFDWILEQIVTNAYNRHFLNQITRRNVE